MRGIRRLAFGVLFVLGLLNPIAQAAPGYVDGNDVPVWQICPITNISAIASQNKVGFFTDPSTSYPKTGDVGYVRAVGSNISPCTNDTIGFDFFLPDGATLAIDSTNRVRCYAIKFTTPNQVIEFTDNPPGFQGGCSQTPSIGTSGGLYFGYAVVAPGWQVDIRVPVRYNKQLLGLAGPTTHRLTAVAKTVWGSVAPFVAVTVYYQASFQNLQSSGVGATTATLGVNLFSYFKGGQLYVDYGTTNSFGLTTPPANVPNNALNFPNVSTSLTGLTPNTTYFWRYRFVTDAGTFNSPTQTFTTSAASTFALTVNKNGTGSGTVTSSPAGINCGATCAASFAQGTTVTLTAAPASGSVFAGWSGGGCSGTGVCTVTMSAAQSVTATFNTAPASTFSLTVNKSGTGSGTISSNPTGINCGATCSAAFSAGTSITLSATAASGSTFAGWSGGGCSGTGTCSLTMNAAQNVTATFNTAQSFGTLNLQVSGLPSGNSATLTITGPDGFNQQRTILTGTGQSLSDVVTGSYTVTAPSVVVSGTTYNPNPASQNVAVTTGSATASVNYTQAPAASFALTVNKGGTGSGTVSSSPAGINCGVTCSATFSSGASVILSPVADAASTFAGWSGACTGTGTCSVTMDAAKTVTATFNTTPAGSPTITAAKPANAPTDATRNKGQSNVLMLAFTLNPSQATQLQNITLQASGSGNDSLDLTAIKLIRDANANGQMDSSETPIATGTFSADNGTLTFTLSTPLALSPGASQFLVAADIASTLAARPAMQKAQSLPALPTPLLLTLLPLMLLGAWRMRSLRAGFLALALALTLAACGVGGPNTTPVNKTYQINLTALSAQGSPTVSGLPITGAIITVQK
ncbi:InlB B-repeat-containing protein [Meiothermus cerbereus]|uniref:InlB B-repeat-containing protein n=1 Tax=Meiothermus cerbereus TaxID=65552 RepID=UPI003EE8FB54